MTFPRCSAAVDGGAEAGAVGAQAAVQGVRHVGDGDVVVATDVDHGEVPGTMRVQPLQPELFEVRIQLRRLELY